MLDSARIDDLVAKYADPRIADIVSRKCEDGSWEGKVGKSSMRPHVVRTEASYKESGKHKSAFYKGQILVPHSSKVEVADGVDLTRMLNERAASLLEKVGVAFSNMATSLARPEGVPVRWNPEAPIRMHVADVNQDYPYTAETLATLIQKSRTGW